MSRLFDDGATEYLKVEEAVVTVPPFTMACWFNSDDITIDQALISIADKDATPNHVLYASGDTGGDPVLAWTYNGAAWGSGVTTTGYSANTWHHACGVWAAVNDRRAYIDGGSKGTNATNLIVPNVDCAAIGRTADSAPTEEMSGRIAEAAIWDVALNDLEAWLLYMGIPPWEIQPAHLMGLWLPFGDRTDRDFSGRGYHMTAFNTPSFASDPLKVVRHWRSNAQYIGRRILGREQPGGVWARPTGGIRVPRPPAAYCDGPTIY